MPVVAIVGRPNVGKSSLLNALVGRRISIVQDMPGVTRDRIAAHMQIDGRVIELVDTGGYGFVDPDQLTDHIQRQIELAMARADLVLFIVDCQAGLHSEDQTIAALLRRRGLEVLLLANKTDGETADASLGEFARLGFGTPIGVSALNGRNIDRARAELGRLLDLTDAPTILPEPEMMVAIVGKRNAGKSTLVNAIARIYDQDVERVIVSEVPGTTRDSVDVRFEKDGQALVVIDTAGVRKKKRVVADDISFYSFHRAQRSIRRADVALLLIDGTQPISEPDRQLARYIAEQYKPVAIVVNKWDLARTQYALQNKIKDETAVDDATLMEEFGKYLSEELKHIDYAPIAFVTAKDGRNVQGVLDLAKHLYKQSQIRLTTGQLNRVVRQILQERTPSTPVGRKARVYYATQTAVAPPTIVLFVNKPDYLSVSYRRHLIHRFREMLPYSEVPIQLLVRGRQQRVPGKSVDEKTDEELDDADSLPAGDDDLPPNDQHG